MDTIPKILMVWIAGMFCFATCFAMILKRRDRKDGKSKEVEGITILKRPQPLKEPCWKLCAYKYAYRMSKVTKE